MPMLPFLWRLRLLTSFSTSWHLPRFATLLTETAAPYEIFKRQNTQRDLGR